MNNIDKPDYVLPRFKTGRTQKDYRMAQLLNLQLIVEDINERI